MLQILHGGSTSLAIHSIHGFGAFDLKLSSIVDWMFDQRYAKPIGGGRVGPGRAMPNQKYGPEIINYIIILIIINYLLVKK